MVGTSGISGERFAVLTPSAFSLPDFMCGMAIGVPTKLTLTIPDIRSCCAGPLPLYGTWLSLMPAMYMKSSVTRCCALPLPELAKSILPGCFFAAAISSFTEFTPSEGCTTRTYGPEAMRITGLKSASASYGISLYT